MCREPAVLPEGAGADLVAADDAEELVALLRPQESVVLVVLAALPVLPVHPEEVGGEVVPAALIALVVRLLQRHVPRVVEGVAVHLPVQAVVELALEYDPQVFDVLGLLHVAVPVVDSRPIREGVGVVGV